MEKQIKIREVSIKYNISARTLRYYEDMGLIESIRSDHYAYRVYDEKNVKRLEQILILRKLNISIKDIKSIFMYNNSEAVLNVLNKKVDDIDEEVALLHELRGIILMFIKQIKDSDFQNEADIKKLYSSAQELEQQLLTVDYQGNSSITNRLLNISEKLEKRPDVRIVELPASKMASSGCDTGDGVLEKFDKWWSEIDAKREDKFYPRDFMWYDPINKGNVWYYALNKEMTDTGGFEVVDFPGGLYAVAVSKDGDNEDGFNVYSGIKKWIDESEHFELDERPGHYTMFHVITSKVASEVMGFGQLEIYVPIQIKQN